MFVSKDKGNDSQSNVGSDWQHAYKESSSALAAATNNAQPGETWNIYVAQGTYTLGHMTYCPIGHLTLQAAVKKT